jgi:AcrR family transcriptional regulator
LAQQEPARHENPLVETVNTTSDTLSEQATGGCAAPLSRSEACELAILESALALVAEVGYDRLSMDALAERAKASKATIYRRWSGKAEVVATALRRRHSENAAFDIDTGSVRSDLLALLDRACTSMASEDGALVTGLFQAMRTDPELAALLRSQVFESKMVAQQEIVQRAIDRGEVSPDADAATLNEILSGVVFGRVVMSGEPLDHAFCVHVVDDILLPVLRR